MQRCDHDHGQCIAALMLAAERRCAERGVRLTQQRRRVLEVVAGSHLAVGAYQILEQLGQDGRLPAPISVYRALDFLVQQGLVHRVASRNAFVACSGPDESHTAQFLICEHCGIVSELRDAELVQTLNRGATGQGFTMTAAIVEVYGACPACVAAGTRPANAGGC
ncbi:transcriptional repressor [Defluviicoccus vanus]|uniref:Transcriptional repressor n=1 Tax=Defluviicoccus vanus TaxID=111831 RepID=A0A7H1N6U9_9PROT|nr:transcriptional repressor [Defluviicoccus vanus]QNT71435.1 transcriptional repressor [Defluviicoccus vanus]